MFPGQCKDADPGTESYLRMEEIDDNRVIENMEILTRNLQKEYSSCR
jgi:hypothetical protein